MQFGNLSLEQKVVFFVVDAELGSVCFVGIMWFEHCACVYLDCLSFWKFRCFFFFFFFPCSCLSFLSIEEGEECCSCVVKIASDY